MTEGQAVMQRQPGWQSRADRKDVLLTGTAVLPDGRRIPVEVMNLSGAGCQLRSDETIGIGDSIHLDFPPFEGVSGTVRWSLFGEAGIRFLGACA